MRKFKVTQYKMCLLTINKLSHNIVNMDADAGALPGPYVGEWIYHDFLCFCISFPLLAQQFLACLLKGPARVNSNKQHDPKSNDST